ncbi:MAG TPA: SRPBCC domain-containing protein [Chitinophagaceae bacterium]
MENFDWSRFETRINIKASTEELYKSWATTRGMQDWFLRVCEYRKPGGSFRAEEEFVEKNDTYKWLWYGYPDDVKEEGEIIDCNGKDFLKFRFGKAGDCTVNILKEEEETIVQLIQENIPTDESGMKNYHLGCKTGWTFYLANLKSIMEGGIDLRNKNEKIKNLVNA